MRPIEFRGICIEKNEWVYGYLFDNGISCRIIPNESVITDNGSLTEYFNVDPKTVGQFTGLYDKEGKKIFECDILYDPDENQLGVIKSWPGYFSFNGAILGVDNLDQDGMELIIRGNIYQNKSLLK